MNLITAIRQRYLGTNKPTKKGKNKGMSPLVFKLEKSKRAKKGKRLIDMSLVNLPVWMCWPVFKRRLWIVGIWSVGAIYFIFKYWVS